LAAAGRKATAIGFLMLAVFTAAAGAFGNPTSSDSGAKQGGYALPARPAAYANPRLEYRQKNKILVERRIAVRVRSNRPLSAGAARERGLKRDRAGLVSRDRDNPRVDVIKPGRSHNTLRDGDLRQMDTDPAQLAKADKPPKPSKLDLLLGHPLGKRASLVMDAQRAKDFRTPKWTHSHTASRPHSSGKHH
jgi:hypothetical protein